LFHRLGQSQDPTKIRKRVKRHIKNTETESIAAEKNQKQKKEINKKVFKDELYGTKLRLVTDQRRVRRFSSLIRYMTSISCGWPATSYAWT